MPIYELTDSSIRPFDETTFAAVGISERGDLQRVLRKGIDVISPGTLVIAEEFGEWEDSRRRIDLLGIDKNANLVVIELKRTEDGGHMELQAIRYAAMVSAMTFENAVDVYRRYLQRNGSTEDAEQSLLRFLDWDEVEEEIFGQNVRIVLASAEFSRELTTSVLWLLDRGIDITCMRLKPHRDGERVLLDVQQIIPLPEAEDYRVRLKNKHERQRESRRDKQSRAGFDVTIDDCVFEDLPRELAIHRVIWHLCAKGVSPQNIEELIEWRSNLFQLVDAETVSIAFAAGSEGYFMSDDQLILHDGRTYALSSSWGNRTEFAIRRLIQAFPDRGIECIKRGKRKWNVTDFFEDITTRRGAEIAAVARKLLEWSEQHSLNFWWGEGKTHGSFYPSFRDEQGKCLLFAAWSSGTVEIQFQFMSHTPFDDDQRRLEVAEQFSHIEGLALTDDVITRRPSFDMELLKDDRAMQTFINVLEGILRDCASATREKQRTL